jgi:hypothetical protein
MFELALEVRTRGALLLGSLPTTIAEAVLVRSVRALLSSGDSMVPLDKVESSPANPQGPGENPVWSIVHRGACQRTTADNLCARLSYARCWQGMKPMLWSVVFAERERQHERSDTCATQAV